MPTRVNGPYSRVHGPSTHTEYRRSSVRDDEKGKGVMEFCRLRLERRFEGALFGVRGRTPAALGFSCSLRKVQSPASLFCYVIKCKQLQRSFNQDLQGGVAPTPLESPKLHEQGGVSTVAGGGFNTLNHPPSIAIPKGGKR